MSDENHIEEFRYYLQEILELADNTVTGYIRAVEDMFQINPKPYNELTLKDLSFYKKEIPKGVPRTIKKRINGEFQEVILPPKPFDSNSMGMFFSGVMAYIDFLARPPEETNPDMKSQRQQHIIHYPKKFFKPPKFNYKIHEKKQLDKSEFDKITEAIKYDLRTTAIHWLMFATEGRESDISRLTLKCIHEAKDKKTGDTIYQLYRWIKKTDESKTVRIRKEVYDAVMDYIRNRDKYLPSNKDTIKREALTLLFVSIFGGRFREVDIWRNIRDAGLQAGIKGVHPHMYRHLCASYLYEQGMKVEKIALHMGITVATLTRFYLHIDEDAVGNEVVEAFAPETKNIAPKPEIITSHPPQQIVTPPPQMYSQPTETDKLLQLELLKKENLKLELELAKAKQLLPNGNSQLYG